MYTPYQNVSLSSSMTGSSAFEQWLLDHMEGVLWAIEIAWVGSVVLIFSLYFVMKWYFNKKKHNTNKQSEKTL